MAEPPIPSEGILLTHFIVSDDVERSRRFYSEVLGGEVVRRGRAVDRRARQRLDHHQRRRRPDRRQAHRHASDATRPDRVSAFLNIRVADIRAVYEEWGARGAEFLTEPRQHATEIRCYIRDPDGHLIEVGQTTPAP